MKSSFWKHKQLIKVLSIGCTLLFVTITTLFAQTEKELILTVRNASNKALKALDEEANFKFLTDDVLITTGAGTLLCGKNALRTYIQDNNGSKPMFWVRQSSEIEVNSQSLLAWEQGIWNGYFADDQEEKNVVVHGKYSAMWTKASGEWKIKSQLFVSLP